MLQEKVELLEKKLRKLEAEPGPSKLGPPHSRKSRKTTSTVTSQRSEPPVDVIDQQFHFNGLPDLSSAMSLEDAGLRNFLELFEPSGSPALDAFVNPTIDFLQPLSTNGSPLLPAITPTDHLNMGSPEPTVRFSTKSPSESDKAVDSSQYSKQVL